MNCPICNKAGLDSNTAVCPQCNSDLSAFTLLNNLKASKSHNNSFNYKSVIALFAIAVIFILIYLLFPKLKIKEVIVNNSVNIDSLKTSVADSLRLISATGPEEKLIRYVVKASDNLTKISKEKFSDVSHIRQIINDNKISNPNYLKEGEVLFIDLSTKK